MFKANSFRVSSSRTFSEVPLWSLSILSPTHCVFFHSAYFHPFKASHIAFESIKNCFRILFFNSLGSVLPDLHCPLQPNIYLFKLNHSKQKRQISRSGFHAGGVLSVTHRWRRWAAGPAWAWAGTPTGPCTSSCSSGEACWRWTAVWSRCSAGAAWAEASTPSQRSAGNPGPPPTGEPMIRSPAWTGSVCSRNKRGNWMTVR